MAGRCEIVIRGVMLVAAWWLSWAAMTLGEDLTLGMSAAFSDPGYALGTEFYRGATAYFTYVSQRQDNPIHVKLIALDDRYLAKKAVLNAIRLLKDERVDALFGFVGTQTVSRVLPLLAVYNLPEARLLFPVTGASVTRRMLYRPVVINFRASYRDEAETLIRYLSSKGCKRLGVFYETNSYGRSGLEGVQKAVDAYGLEPVQAISYAVGADFDDSFDQHAALLSKVDAVICVGHYRACAGFIRDSRSQGLTIPIAHISSVCGERLLAMLQELDDPAVMRRIILAHVVPHFNQSGVPMLDRYREHMDRFAQWPPYVDTSDNAPRYSMTSLEGYLAAFSVVEAYEAMLKNPQVSLEKALEVIDIPISPQFRLRCHHPDHERRQPVFLSSIQNQQWVPLIDPIGRW